MRFHFRIAAAHKRPKISMFRKNYTCMHYAQAAAHKKAWL